MNETFSTANNPHSHAQAKEQAYEAASRITPSPTAVVEYYSHGNVTAVGSKKELAEFGDKIPADLTFQPVIMDNVEGIRGALGDFHIQLKDSASSIKTDIIVDLGNPPMLTMPVKPPGYFAPAVNRLPLATLAQELSGLKGTFEKPRYFNYNAEICAHGRSGKRGCTRCMDACPTLAITSLKDKIEVDPYRCQGGGICATVCPSGAIQYSFPKPLDLLKRIRVMIFAYTAKAATGPELVFASADEEALAATLQPDALLLIVEEVASVGLEVWLAALAWGAKSVSVYDTLGMPATSRAGIDLNLSVVHALLSALSLPEAAICLITRDSDSPKASMPDLKPAQQAALEDKRQALFFAFDHLYEQTNVRPESRDIELPAGSIFGAINVDQDACTLCMSCVSVCPANALQDGREMPRLGFIEGKCLQCGLCEVTCPESAITLTPRFTLDKNARQSLMILHQQEPFCCVSCGKPFATQSGITTIMEKLANHPMFATERAKTRLKMCDDCRVKDMMQDPAANL